MTGSAAGVYDDLPWIAPLKSFLRDVDGRAKLVGLCFGHQILAAAFGGTVEKSAKGWGIGLHTYDLFERADWMDDATRISVPAIHQDQVIVPPFGRARSRRQRLHTLRHPVLPATPGDLVPGPSGIRNRLRHGSDCRAPAD